MCCGRAIRPQVATETIRVAVPVSKFGAAAGAARVGRSQFLRFAFAGIGLTLLSAAIYSVLVLVSVPPLIAISMAHGCGIAAGFVVHGRWSFAVAPQQRDRAAMARFLTASALAFGLNNLWVWLAVDWLGLPSLSPLPAIVILTPLLSFALNRYWVFRAA